MSRPFDLQTLMTIAVGADIDPRMQVKKVIADDAVENLQSYKIDTRMELIMFYRKKDWNMLVRQTKYGANLSLPKLC